jgi:hypothetical protein
MSPHHDDWIGVDLDRTLAVRSSGDSLQQIGPPIHAMVNRVKAWLRAGNNVKIVTARVHPSHDDADDQRRLIQQWCVGVIGIELEVTCMKDHRMIELWDDLAVRVEENTGRQLSPSCDNPSPRPQHDVGALGYIREAVELLRRQRDQHGDKSDKYDELTVVARNLRDTFEWLYPLHWTDPEHVPFRERKW